MTPPVARSLSLSQPRGLLAFTCGYMAAAAVGAWVTGNREFIFYGVVMLVLLSGVWRVHRRTGLTPGLLWMLSIWGVLHMAGGLVPVPAGWPLTPTR